MARADHADPRRLRSANGPVFGHDHLVEAEIAECQDRCEDSARAAQAPVEGEFPDEAAASEMGGL